VEIGNHYGTMRRPITYYNFGEQKMAKPLTINEVMQPRGEPCPHLVIDKFGHCESCFAWLGRDVIVLLPSKKETVSPQERPGVLPFYPRPTRRVTR